MWQVTSQFRELRDGMEYSTTGVKNFRFRLMAWLSTPRDQVMKIDGRWFMVRFIREKIKETDGYEDTNTESRSTRQFPAD